jgi:hypothetical protein
LICSPISSKYLLLSNAAKATLNHSHNSVKFEIPHVSNSLNLLQQNVTRIKYLEDLKIEDLCESANQEIQDAHSLNSIVFQGKDHNKQLYTHTKSGD